MRRDQAQTTMHQVPLTLFLEESFSRYRLQHCTVKRDDALIPFDPHQRSMFRRYDECSQHSRSTVSLHSLPSLSSDSSVSRWDSSCVRQPKPYASPPPRRPRRISFDRSSSSGTGTTDESFATQQPPRFPNLRGHLSRQSSARTMNRPAPISRRITRQTSASASLGHSRDVVIDDGNDDGNDVAQQEEDAKQRKPGHKKRSKRRNLFRKTSSRSLINHQGSENNLVAQGDRAPSPKSVPIVIGVPEKGKPCRRQDVV